MKWVFSIVVSVLAASLSMAQFAGQASAQELQPDIQAAPSDQVSEQEVDSYAKAVIQVVSIQQDVDEQAEEQGIDEPTDEMKRQAVGKMAMAVQKEGLSVDRFNEITLGSKLDPQLSNRIIAKLEAQNPRQGEPQEDELGPNRETQD